MHIRFTGRRGWKQVFLLTLCAVATSVTGDVVAVAVFLSAASIIAAIYDVQPGKSDG
jgi:hypothetical protein